MKKHSILFITFSLLTLLACRCTRPEPVAPERDNRPTPERPKVSPSPIREGELRRELTNVAAGDDGIEPLPFLSDNVWHKISGDTRVRTDENGEGWLKLQGCMLIYIFQATQMTTAPCSKSEYASGHVNCQSSGTAVYNSSCGPQAELLVQTPTTNIKPHGTWFSVTYVPEQQSTLVVVFDGSVDVTPVKDVDTRSLGESTTINAGQAWVTVPDNKLNSDNDFIGGTERTVTSVSDYQSVIKSLVGPWLGRIQERAKKDGIENSAIQFLAPPPQAPASPENTEIKVESDIDCDCKNLVFDKLRRGYQKVCLQVEQNLKSQFREAGRVVGRCDPESSGPNARPK